MARARFFPWCKNLQRDARHAFKHSLRFRLVVMFLLLAASMTITFVLGMQQALRIGWRDAAKPLATDYVHKLAAEIGDPPSVERAQALVARLPLTVRISGPVVNWSSPGADTHYLPSWRGPSAAEPRWEAEGPRFFERTTADGHLIRFGLNAQDWHDRPRFMGWITLGVLLVLTALLYWRVRRLLRPLDDIRAGAQRFGAGDFTQDIPVRHAHHPDELGQLAATINTMGADIHQMLEAKRALLLAISHELRSPLTRARLNTELLPDSPEVQASRDALLRDLGLMRDLVTDLLESERLANRHAPLYREPTDLAALAHEVVASLPGAAGVQVQIDPGLPLQSVDPHRVRLLLRNLLDNALRHSAHAAQGPQLQITPLPGAAGLRITVRDFGPGVPDAQLPHLGQPFYRPDSARTREGGGVGLGLYLCRLVAQAHGGAFFVRNAKPGLAVQADLPAPPA
jgi:signal transduction histidine kinase